MTHPSASVSKLKLIEKIVSKLFLHKILHFYSFHDQLLIYNLQSLRPKIQSTNLQDFGKFWAKSILYGETKEY